LNIENQKKYNTDVFHFYIEKYPIEICTPVYIAQFNFSCHFCNKKEQVVVFIVSGIKYDNAVVERPYVLQFIYDLPNVIRHNLYNYPSWRLNTKYNLYLNHCSDCKSVILDTDIYNELSKIDKNEIQITKLNLPGKNYYVKSSYRNFPEGVNIQ